MKKPFLYALVTAVYIVFIINAIDFLTSNLSEEKIFIPIAMLSLFVLSVAVMGFLFFYEPINLYMENKKQEAVVFFGKMIGFFACFTVVFFILLFIL